MKKIQPKNQLANNNEIKKENPASIGYQGKVTLTLKRKNTVVWTKTSHNEGKQDLFRFICLCLKGSYNTANVLKPNSIYLVNNQNSIDNPDSNPSQSIKVSQNIGIYGVPEEDTLEGEEMKNKDAYQITFHFLVPYSAILINTGAIDTIEFNQINLITKDGILLARYFLTKEGQWDPQTITTRDLARGFTLLVDWTLIFGNEGNLTQLLETE